MSSPPSSSSASQNRQKLRGIGNGQIDLGASTGVDRGTISVKEEALRTPYVTSDAEPKSFTHFDSHSLDLQIGHTVLPKRHQRPSVEYGGQSQTALRDPMHAHQEVESSKPKSSERVFPMSSVVAVDPQSKQARQVPDSINSEDSTEYEYHPINVRFQHIETAEGHMILTGHAEGIQRCEDEPIRIPGAIQGFGALIAVGRDQHDHLVVRQCSENTSEILGLSPSYLFSLQSLTEVLSPDQRRVLLENIDYVEEADEDREEAGPHVFLLSGWGIDQGNPVDGRRGWTCWCAVHKTGGNELLILEFEAEKDYLYPLTDPNSSEITPENKSAMAGEDLVEPSVEDLIESTESLSKPLRSLARIRKYGSFNAMDSLTVLSQVSAQLATAQDLQTFLKIAVGCVKQLTGFHRVMIYQFDEDWNGKVVTELVDRKATHDLYRGLNFPATDIPAQARELYRINKVRLLYDRSQPTARMICRTPADLNKPLDMTFAYLRAMSPIHIKYLGNMGVRASMSISIMAFGQLWGLISCHSYGDFGMRVSFPIRKMCRLLGETISRNIERLSYASRLNSKKLINTVSTPENPGGYIVAKAEDLLALFDADFGVLSIGEEGRILGHTDNSTEIIALLQYLRQKRYTEIKYTSDIHKDFPDAKYRGGDFETVSGILLVPLSILGNDFIVFFRKGQLKQIHWAGNPYEKILREGTTAYLEPRKSFHIWSETVAGKARAWTHEQVETASVLCIVYGKFIEVWRQKEAALQTSQLTNLLLANASHEVRTPLNAIINYLELALDGPLDGDTRENLAKSHAASKSLVYVINDLLDLTRHEAGKELLSADTFDLSAAVQEASIVFRSDAERKGLVFSISEYPGVPTHVVGDQRRLKQIISNTISNALKHTDQGSITVEVWERQRKETVSDLEILIVDTGCGIATHKLDQIFRDFEEIESVDEPNVPAAGLGLAIVARAIRTLKGQMRVESEVGKGTQFSFRIPFVLPLREPSVAVGGPLNIRSSTGVSTGEIISQRTRTPTASKPALTRRHSGGSVGSGSAASEIDSLVDALSHTSVNDLPPRLVPSSPGLPQGSPPSPFHPLNTETPPPSAFSRATDNSGTFVVEGSSIPGRSVRVDDVDVHYDVMSRDGLRRNSAPNIDPSLDKTPTLASFASAKTSPGTEGNRPVLTPSSKSHKRPTFGDVFNVLVVEDDPVNRMIMHRRLKNDGQNVTLTVHGEDAHQTIRMSDRFDVVLMDIQVSW